MAEDTFTTRDARRWGQISDETGFDSGNYFTSEQQVRDYFTPAAQCHMFGDDAITDQKMLESMADLVIERGWHMVSGS